MQSIKTKMKENGRIVIPKLFRDAMQLEQDSDIVIKLIGDEIRITHLGHSINKVRESLKKNKNKFSVDDFLSFRKKDTKE
jgi:bifunctional DNA-binding transcriptional regulator/antitoxin component of YhaV-PrlF toxin-antitoxin module